MYLWFLVNCDSALHDSKIGINVAIIQSACWDAGDAVEEIRHVGLFLSFTQIRI